MTILVRRLPILLLAILATGCTKEPPPLMTDNTPFEAPDDAPFWPRFHGPNGDNMSSDTGLFRQWPEQGPTLAWTADGIGLGFAGITTAGGLIYTAGNLGGYTVVTALTLDGKVRWQGLNGEAWDDDYEGTRGTPTLDGAHLYHESPLGELTCFDAVTGKKVWGMNTLDRFDAENLNWALAESVLVDGDRVICCPGGEVAMAALDKRTGDTVWTARGVDQPPGYASPTLVEYEGLRMILTMTAKSLIGVDAGTGKLLFRHQHETKYDVNVLMPLFHEGHVFVSSGYGRGSQMLKINVSGQAATVEKLWDSSDLDNQHGGVVLIDGHLYGACQKRHRGRWVCLDFDTGEMKYAERGVGKGSLTSADGLLYTLSEKGAVGLVEATPTGHQVISQFKIPTAGDDGPSWAHPVVVGGRLYIRHADRLYAYNVRTTALQGRRKETSPKP